MGIGGINVTVMGRLEVVNSQYTVHGNLYHCIE